MTKYCDACHAPNRDRAKFCRGCAGKFSGVRFDAAAFVQTLPDSQAAKSIPTQRAPRVKLSLPPGIDISLVLLIIALPLLAGAFVYWHSSRSPVRAPQIQNPSPVALQPRAEAQSALAFFSPVGLMPERGRPPTSDGGPTEQPSAEQWPVEQSAPQSPMTVPAQDVLRDSDPSSAAQVAAPVQRTTPRRRIQATAPTPSGREDGVTTVMPVGVGRPLVRAPVPAQAAILKPKAVEALQAPGSRTDPGKAVARVVFGCTQRCILIEHWSQRRCDQCEFHRGRYRERRFG